MRSVQIRSTGGPEVVTVAEVSAPRAPRADELLISVRASSINGTDLGIRRGDLAPLTTLRRPFPLGFDLAGIVIDRGPAVTGFDLGDAVCALIGHLGGAQSDLVLVRQTRAAHVPSQVPLVTAGALPLAGLTALQGLYRPGALPGRTAPRVLILGASGGIGALAIQLAKHAGAVVTGTTTARTAAFVAELGADEILDRHQGDPLHSGEHWDIIFDTPGRTRMRDARTALRAGGIFVTTRGISADALKTITSRRSDHTFTAVHTAARTVDLAHLLRLIADDALRVPLEHAYPVAQIVDAHRAADHGSEGKIGVTFSS